MKAIAWVASVVVVASVAYAAWADEEKVPLDKLPKEIKATLMKRFPKAEMKEASKETTDGKTEYEVSIKDGETKIDVTFTPEGALLGIEKQIPAKDLPKAVKDAIEAKYVKSTIKLAEEVIKVKDGKENLEYYEAVVETSDKKKTFELQIKASGEITKTEEKTDQKD